MTQKQDRKSEYGYAGTTISGRLINQVRMLYELSIQDIFSRAEKPIGINGFSSHVLAGYIITLAAVEAFLNEVFLDVSAELAMKDAALWKFPKDWIEKIEISKKVILIPQLLFGKSLHCDKQPYQDFAMVIKIRNDLVHYKMRNKPPNYVVDLDQRGLLIKSPAVVDYAWPDKLSCSEGLRWAHNTACNVVIEIVSYMEGIEYFLLSIAENFEPINEEDVRKLIDSINQ